MELNLRVLKAKIRGLEAEGRSLRKRITKSSGLEKDRLWCLKRELGFQTRAHLVAYGLLRGAQYENIEPISVLNWALPKAVHDVIMTHTFTWHHNDWPLERIMNIIHARARRQKKSRAAPVVAPSQETPKQPEPSKGGNIRSLILEILGRMS